MTQDERATDRRNLELKAIDPAPDATLAAALDLGCVPAGTLSQRDTYFRASVGRLKLREEQPGVAHLIQYDRSTEARARQSTYRIVAVPDPAAMTDALAASLGVLVVVRKRRRLLLLDTVRVHLDEVEGLGAFVELEAVVPPGGTVDGQVGPLRHVREALGITDDRLIGDSYSDLLGSRR